MAKRAAPSLEEIAAEAGRLFGTTEAHARKWLQQRKVLLEALHLVRNKATDLIGELSEDMRRRFDGRANPQAGRTHAMAGDPAKQTPGRKRRPLSAATRAKMRAAAKKRWAAEKRKKG